MKKNFFKLAPFVLSLPRVSKRFIALSVDLILCILSVWLAYFLRLGEFINLSGNALLATVASVAIALPVFIVSGFYRAIFRYSGWPAFMAVARAISIYAIIYAIIFTVIGVADIPRTVGIIQPILLLLLVE